MKQNKEYYLVKDVVAVNDGVLIADSSVVGKDIPVDAANVNVITAETTDGNYRLYKLVEGETAPTGDYAVPLSSDEARLAVQSGLFNAQPTNAFVRADFAKCDEIRAAFMAAQSGMGQDSAEALLTALEQTSIALNLTFLYPLIS